MYVPRREEAYAPLRAITSFAIIAGVMYLTRNLSWHSSLLP